MLQHFINLKAKELKLVNTPQLELGAIDYLMQYHWPGNVRELQNVVERALILNPKGPISFKNLDIGKEKRIHEPISDSDEILSLEEMNYRHIEKVLRAVNGKIHGTGGAADLLKVNANTLRNKMDKLGINYKKK